MILKSVRSKTILVFIVFLFPVSCGTGYQKNRAGESRKVSFSSSDSMLVNIFNWAKTRSDSFVGKDSDPVGPWYEAALPGREAFCIRDVSHQSVSAEILGHSNQNLNMLRKFVENISESKDWCSYWEINRYNKPAPVDYSSDDDFWYNLNANFDLVDACFKLFRWTGDTTYINDESFDRFFRITLNEYVERWQLQPDRIMERPARMNIRPGTVRFREARGIPSYDESQEDISVSGDLLGMIYNGFMTYSKILELRGNVELSKKYRVTADKYASLIDSLWWDEKTGSYNGFYRRDGNFRPGGSGQSEFLLWYGAIRDPQRIEKSLQELSNSQVEVLSYLPALFYRYSHNEEAYGFLCKLYSDKRRDYPEASAGILEGIVRGTMGIEPDAAENLVATCPRLTGKTDWAMLEDLKVFCGKISVKHESNYSSVFENKTQAEVKWRAMFNGRFEKIKVNGKEINSAFVTDGPNGTLSFVDINIPAGQKAFASALR